MVTYLIEFDDLTNSTELGGNVDVGSYAFCIENAQDAVLRELLGDTLYDKIEADYKAKILTGDYLYLYEKFIRPILINASMVEYYTVGAFKIANGGIFKHAPANGQAAEIGDVSFLKKQKQSKVDMYVQRCQRWLFKNKISEYNWHYENNVNPNPAGFVQNLSFINKYTVSDNNLKRYILGVDSQGNKL